MKFAELVRIGDIFAIPMFALLIYYLWSKPESLSTIEKILLFFGICGFIADSAFSIHYIYTHKFISV